jgi:hypothetical protein
MKLIGAENQGQNKGEKEGKKRNDTKKTKQERGERQ